MWSFHLKNGDIVVSALLISRLNTKLQKKSIPWSVDSLSTLMEDIIFVIYKC